MSEDKLTFQLLFTIPRMASAYARHPDGGARLKIDIEESTVAAANAMLDLMVQHPQSTFAAVIVVIKEPETCTELYDATEESSEREVARMDLRRSRKRRNKQARGGV